MSPTFTPDLTKVTATLELFPDGLYEFTIGPAKSFTGRNVEGDEKYGVRYSLKIEVVHEDGDQNAVGKRAIFSCNLHNDGGQSMSKQFLIAAYDYGGTNDDEQQFNEEVGAEADWSVDTDNEQLGSIWTEISGNRILAALSTVPSKKDPTQSFQQFNWIPMSKLAAA